MPTTNSVNQIYQAVKDLKTTLKEHPNPSTPYLEFGDATLNALRKLASIFDRSSAVIKPKSTITEDSHQPPRVQTLRKKGDQNI